MGKLMVQAAEDHRRAHGCRHIDIDVLTLRPELFPFYRKLGYMEVRTAEFHPSRPLNPGAVCEAPMAGEDVPGRVEDPYARGNELLPAGWNPAVRTQVAGREGAGLADRLRSVSQVDAKGKNRRGTAIAVVSGITNVLHVRA